MREKVECISCGEYFDLDEDRNIDDIIYCPECGSQLKIISLNPPEVEPVENENLREDLDEDNEEDL
ncbi:MAG: hypothetical protein PHI86_03480 [Candidatus Omnitrophica bacterium]|nr:hypothetical protein [Candidatus Omnitrophota bacterium]HOX54783.1 hypothetical protein [Candidatus Omnitrophota bacterium]